MIYLYQFPVTLIVEITMSVTVFIYTNFTEWRRAI